MKKGWQEKSVGDIIQLEYGKPLEQTDRKPNGRFPVYGANGEKDRTDKFYHDKPSIIVGRKGSAGEINLTEKKFWPLDVTYFVTFDDQQYDLQFIYYLLTTLELKKLAKGVKPGINRNEVYSQVTRVPPLAEQQRIVGLLDEAFEGLATAKANAEKNLQNARSLFESHLQSVFTQAPLSGVEGRGPGWVKTTLGEALVKTETINPTHSPQTEFDYIDVSSVSKETLAIQVTQRLQGKDAPSRARKLVRTNDVLFATIRPTLRRIAIVPEELDSQVCSTGYFVLRAKPDVDYRFVFYFLQTETFMTAMKKLQKGASYPAVTDGDIRSQSIPIPPLREQKKIAAKLNSFREETQRLACLYERKLAALEALKKSLLHQAFTGEL